MKTALSLIFIFLMSFSASAHQGKTDYRGGHKCWKNCGEWELLSGEYHLHDEDWKPVRLDHKGTVPEPSQPGTTPTSERRFLPQEPAVQVSEPAAGMKENKIPAQTAVVEKHQTLTIYEESILPFQSILLLFLALLMLIVLVFVRKKREKE